MTALRILCVIIFLPMIASGYGTLFSMGNHGNKRMKSAVSRYLTGIFFILAAFEIVSVPLTMVGRPFHELCYAGIAICAGGGILFVYDMIFRHGWAVYLTWIRNLIHLLRTYWWIIAPAGIILLQILRSVVRTTSVYSDDKIYIDRINDMLYLDTILETDVITGAVSRAARLGNPKFVLSSWLQLLAVLCSLAGVHPLIMIKSVFPVFMISFHYLIIWKLTGYLGRSYKERILMMLFYSLLMEFGSVSLRTDFSYYLFTWSWYGKTFYQFAVIPGILLFFLMVRDYMTGWRDGVLVMIICLAGICASSTALMLLPIELAVLILFECISKRSVRELWISVPALAPIAMCAVMYFVLF